LLLKNLKKLINGVKNYLKFVKEKLIMLQLINLKPIAIIYKGYTISKNKIGKTLNQS
jgi:hypothetical protein